MADHQSSEPITPFALGDEVRILDTHPFNGRDWSGRTGQVTAVYPYEGGCGYYVTVVEGLAPLPVWHQQLEQVTP